MASYYNSPPPPLLPSDIYISDLVATDSSEIYSEYINSTIDSISSTTGSLIISGGLGLSKSLVVGNTITTGNLITSSLTLQNKSIAYITSNDTETSTTINSNQGFIYVTFQDQNYSPPAPSGVSIPCGFYSTGFLTINIGLGGPTLTENSIIIINVGATSAVGGTPYFTLWTVTPGPAGIGSFSIYATNIDTGLNGSNNTINIGDVVPVQFLIF